MNKILPGAMAAFALASISAPAASAATLILDSAGILHGATGVMVNGVAYTVTLTDGSCAEVYGTCEPSSFDFTSQADAGAAAQAVLDQVYVNIRRGENYSSGQLNLAFGCGGDSCGTFVTYASTPGQSTRTGFNPGTYASAIAVNVFGTTSDTVTYVNRSQVLSPGNTNLENFARFTRETAATVPEPAAWVAMTAGFGLAGAAIRRKRRVRAYS